MQLWFIALLVTAGPSAAHFEFPAAAGRLNTGLYVRRGEIVDVTVSGAWTMWSGKYGLSNANGHRQFDGIYCWGRLMGQVGAGVPVSVGTGRKWLAADSGLLVFYPHSDRFGLPAPGGTLKITVSGGRPVTEVIGALSAKATVFDVPATGDGLQTGIYVEDGEAVTVDAFGEWRMFDGGPWLTPDGDGRRVVEDGLRWGALVARFGGPTFAAGRTYHVGAGNDVRPLRGGLLWLAPATGEYGGHARSGALKVVVRGGSPATPAQMEAARRRVGDEQRALAFLRIHQLRTAMSLPSAFTAPDLMRAAQAHADYLAARATGDHEQEAGQPGFTGRTPAERAAAAGYQGTVAGELIHGYADGITAVDGLWGTVYHRVPLVDPAATAYGVGVACDKRPVCVILAGVPQEQPKDLTKVPECTTFPADGQVNAPTTWSGQEDPSPWSGAVPGPVGYPISLTLTRADITKVTEAVLLDQTGQIVDAQVLAPDRDPRGLLRASLFLVARQALRPNRSYRCRVSLLADQTPVSLQWEFTTSTNRSPLLALPRLGLVSNPPLELAR